MKKLYLFISLVLFVVETQAQNPISSYPIVTNIETYDDIIVNQKISTGYTTRRASFDNIEASSYIGRGDRLFNFAAALQTAQTNFVFALIGDSVIENKSLQIEAHLKSLFTVSGYSLSQLSPTLSVNAFTVSGAFTNWITGNYHVVTNGDGVAFGYSGTTPVFCNQIKVFLIADSLGGTVKIQTAEDGGAYADEAGFTSVSCNSTTITNVILTIPKTKRYWTVKVVGLTGTNKVIGVDMRSTNDFGAVMAGFHKGGVSIDQMLQVNTDIFYPIVQAIAPDVNIFEVIDPPTIITNYLAAHHDLFWNANTRTNTDWIYCGSNPQGTIESDEAQRTQNSFIRNYALTNGNTYFDGYTPFISTNAMNAMGWLADGTHPSITAREFIVAKLFDNIVIPSSSVVVNRWIRQDVDPGSDPRARTGVWNKTSGSSWVVRGHKNSTKHFTMENSDGTLRWDIQIYADNDATWPRGIAYNMNGGGILYHNVDNGGHSTMGLNSHLVPSSSALNAYMVLVGGTTSDPVLHVRAPNGQTAPLQYWSITNNIKATMAANGVFTTITNLNVGGILNVTNAAIATRYIMTRSVVTYSASMTPDASLGNIFEISANNGVAFTINAPSNPTTNQRITFTLRNISGGALGAATWDVIFKMSAWTNPANANSRSIDFIYNGTNWVEASRTTADVPN
jgi:hypothetical protein